MIDLVARRFLDHFGTLDAFGWGTTRAEALLSLDSFVADCLPLFGDYQDAMVTGGPFLYHATLSPYLNAGLLVLTPDEAVFAGVDGLDLMSTVVTRSAALLRPGGVLAVEHDDTQGRAVPALLAADGRWTQITDHDDLTGRPRYATARRT